MSRTAVCVRPEAPVELRHSVDRNALRRSAGDGVRVAASDSSCAPRAGSGTLLGSHDVGCALPMKPRTERRKLAGGGDRAAALSAAGRSRLVVDAMKGRLIMTGAGRYGWA